MKAPVVYFLLVLGFAAVAQASEALSVVPDSAQALGIVGGRYANLSDASAVRVSPANILQIKQSELLINTAIWHGDNRFYSNNGQSTRMINPWVFPASMYFVQPIIPDRLSFGIGLSTPYGTASTYQKNMSAPLRYALPYAGNLLTVDITPAVAFQVTDSLSVAIGLDIMYADLKLKQYYDWSALPGFGGSPEGDIQMHGQGWGLGAYAGINWRSPSKRHRFALVGRLPVKVSFRGDFKATSMPAGVPGAYGFSPSSSFNSDMTFPGSISLGYGYDMTDRFTVGFDFKWSQNSSHDDLPLLIGNNQGLLGGATSSVFGWKDSIDLGTGMTYLLNENWTLRGGYLFSESFQTATNYTPVIPSGDRNIFSLGVGWRGKTRSVDLTYAFVYNPTRAISGASQPLFDGTYKQQWHVLALSFTQRF